MLMETINRKKSKKNSKKGNGPKFEMTINLDDDQENITRVKEEVEEENISRLENFSFKVERKEYD